MGGATTRSYGDLVLSLNRRGVRLWAEKGELRFQAPKDTLLPEERLTLQRLRAELIEFLEQGQYSTDAALQPRPAESRIPLTAMQARFWSQRKHEVRYRLRTNFVATRVLGNLDLRVLRDCLTYVIARHEPLRTRFIAIEATVAQQVDPPAEYLLDCLDLSSVSVAAAQAEVDRLARAFAAEEIDFCVGPLFAVKLFRLSIREHVLILALNHMITDGVSNEILHRELWTLYDQISKALMPSLPPLAVQFPDYALWQHQTHGDWLEKHESYWKRHLTGAPAVRLPQDPSATAAAQPIGAVLTLPFGDLLSARLRELAQREKSLLAVVAFTLYIVVMARWCNQQDLLIRLVFNARYRPELESMLGFLANQLYLRIEVKDDDTFPVLLKRVSRELYAAYDHMDFDRAPDFVPECGTTELVFNWAPELLATLERHETAADLTLQSFPLRPARVLDFMPFLCDSPGGILAIVEYRIDRFSEHTVETFGSRLRLVAERFALDPLAAVKSLTSVS
jgi:hypothetical protein